MAPFPGEQFEQPRQAVRDASRQVHRIRLGGRHRDTPVFFGVVLMGLGLLFLLDNLNIIEARYFFRNLWPLLIIIWGVSRVIYGYTGEKIFGAIAAGFGGLLFANRLFDWDLNIVGLFWPLILIGLGLNVLMRPRRGHRGSTAFPPIPPVPPLPGTAPKSPYVEFDGTTGGPTTGHTHDNVEQSAMLREVAIMAGIERRNVSQTFRGGTITTIMGSVEVDLRDCRMAEDSASIWIQAILGHVVLRLPPNWTVESRLSAVMGNLEDRSDRPVDSAPKRLFIEGTAFMGQVEIRN